MTSGFFLEYNRKVKGAVAFLGFLLLALPSPPLAASSIAGVCPDGSVFIVSKKADIPCRRARLVEPSEIPPLRPELLPRPYPWMVDQEARNPNNPYNLLEAAEAVRALHGHKGSSIPDSTAEAPAPSHAVVPLRLPAEEVEALIELVDLRQSIIPATLRAEDALGRGRLEVQFAYSRAFETHALEWLDSDPAQGSVVLFAVRALETGEFYPSFFFLQHSEGFRPDPGKAREVGFLIGSPGPLEPGAIRVGYVVLPGRFRPSEPMELWWNDRRVEATLEPTG